MSALAEFAKTDDRLRHRRLTLKVSKHLRFRAETPKGAGKLAAAGVKFAFQSGGATSIGDFFTNAGKAVEGGLRKDAAIRAMTLGSAEILGR